MILTHVEREGGREKTQRLRKKAAITEATSFYSLNLPRISFFYNKCHVTFT